METYSNFSKYFNFHLFSYGDKSPKSIVARSFSIIWIMIGLIIMAIFTANVTSSLTAVSLELTPSSLIGVKVGFIDFTLIPILRNIKARRCSLRDLHL